MIPSTILTMLDGVRIVVPDSLDMVTPYVLREQEDWFEDEIKFLRRMLQPNQNVIDIGANYGVYTLSMARKVGRGGRVWAFEPASSTASLLEESIAENGFTQVVLQRCALSSTSGTAQLSLNHNSENNSLLHDQRPSGASETVSLASLDECMNNHGWHNIDFVKIDAEGEEANILQGGKHFFDMLSPLVQYEIKAGDHWHMELVQAFAAMGYDSYRLVPGLDLLVPFQIGSEPDAFLLNLFCCKPDCAARLSARGFLVSSMADSQGADQRCLDLLTERLAHDNVYDWRYVLANLPYGAQLARLWEQTAIAGRGGVVDKALAFHALSRNASLSATERFVALAASFDCFKALCENAPEHLRLVSFARVAREFGARWLARNALAQFIGILSQQNSLDMSEPFLLSRESFDSMPCGEALGNWVLSTTIEEFELIGNYSSYFSGLAALPRLETIRELGFASPEMRRRLSLIQQRFSSTTSVPQV